jgi:catechol 2,3-dioxygenase-like lactoylglutathione lyase family enzyme
MPNIDHVDLVVTSLDASLPFYREVLGRLGFDKYVQIDGERGETIHYIGATGMRCAIGLRERQSDAHGVPYDRYGVGVHHVCLHADSQSSIDQLAEWLRESGHTIESGPELYDYSPGYYAVFFYDPDGIKLEVMTKVD